jgi:peroxiredoxin
MVLPRACFLLFAVSSLASCGGPSESDPVIAPPTGGDNNDDDDDGDDGPTLDCGPTFDDDLVLAYDDQTAAPDEIVAVAAVDGVAVVGGDGFAAVLDDDGGFGEALEIDGEVTAMTAVDDRHVALATGSGEVIVAEVDGDELVQNSSTSVGGRARGLASDGATIWVALGGDGLRALSVQGGDAAAFGNVAVARGVALAGARLVVAAGSEGVVVLDDAGAVVGTVPTETAVHGVVAAGERAIALRGAQGWDLLDVGGSAPELVASMTTGGISLDAAFVDGGVLVVEGWAVTRFAVDGGAPEAIGVEQRRDVGELEGAWLRGIARMGDGWVVVDDDAAIPLEVRHEADAPNIAVDVPSFGVWAEPGETSASAYLVRNTGTEDLLIGSVEADGDFAAALQTDALEEDAKCDGYFAVPPGATVLVDLEFDAGDDPSEGTLTILSNDPDEPRLEIPLDGNRERMREGDDAVDFTGLTLDGELFRLSDHEGKVVFLKMFNYGCATCAEEFDDVQHALVPSFAQDDFVAVGVNTSHRTAYAEKVATDAGLSIPVVLDIDSEAFRHYRVPNHVFPLHIVIGRDGKIAHVNDQAGLELVEAAVRAAM